MNLIHRSLWNAQTGTFVAVSENTRSGGKKISSGASAAGGGHGLRPKALTLCLMLACGAGLHAQPVGGVVAAGSATIGGTAASMVINQTTPNAVINWQSFGIQAGESVQFVQPTSSSVTLNRVVGANPSSILGSLTANGKVFLVNPNGILFSQNAAVNVGGLVASTLGISDTNFLAGNYTFSDPGAGTLVNNGKITAADGGYVALLGTSVTNHGEIESALGTVALAAGSALTLALTADKLINVTVDRATVNTLVENGSLGIIRANGGQVLMTTQAASSLLANAVNNKGAVQAQTLATGENGSIRLLGGLQSGGSVALAGGTLDASAPISGNAGTVETSAAQITGASSALVTTAAAAGQTGQWRISSPDFTVGAGGNITGAALGASLLASNVTIAGTGTGTGGVAGLGDVNVNDAVTWTAPNTLTLEAARDVSVNQAITATDGSLVARAGRNVNVDAAITTTTGNLALQAANNITTRAAATITTGDLTAVAGGSVYIDAPMTVTTGNMMLRADNDGTGPGAAAGTVVISCGNNCLTITTGTLDIRFNPATYATIDSEILAYDANLTGGGGLEAKAWVFANGPTRVYDGTTDATLAGLRPDTGNVLPPVALGTVSDANFDTRHVGTDKPITFKTSFSDAKFDLFAPAGMAAGTYAARGSITPRALTVSAATETRVYNGTTSAAGTPTSTGLVAGDTLAGSFTQAYASKDVLGTGQSTLMATGPYSVVDGNGGQNYTVDVVTAPGTVTPAPLVVTADNQTKTYGQAFVFSGAEFTTQGLLQADTVGRTTLISAGAPAAAHVAGSPYPIVPSAASGGSFIPANYAISYVNGVMTVTPAPLTVAASDATKAYGQTATLPTTAFTTVGLQNGETVGSVSATSPGTVASAIEGPYAITPTGASSGTFSPGDYAITYTDGRLVVTPAAVVTPPGTTVPGIGLPGVTAPAGSVPVAGTPVTVQGTGLSPFPFPAIQSVPPAAAVPGRVPPGIAPPPLALAGLPPASLPPVFLRVVEPAAPAPQAPTPEPAAALPAPATAPAPIDAPQPDAAPQRASKQDRN